MLKYNTYFYINNKKMKNIRLIIDFTLVGLLTLLGCLSDINSLDVPWWVFVIVGLVFAFAKYLKVDNDTFGDAYRSIPGGGIPKPKEDPID